MSETALISIIVCVYNTGIYLDKCIDSLLAQTYLNYEILIIDDGSTDGSSNVCDRQRKKSSSIRVFHKSNTGLSASRNYGIDRAKGEYIIFPDPDDWVQPTYLEDLLIHLEQNQADLSICGYFTYSNGIDTSKFKGEESKLLDRYEAMSMTVHPAGSKGYMWNKLFRMDIINAHRITLDEKQGSVEDLFFCVSYIQYCNRIAFTSKPLYHYNRDSNGVTTFSCLTNRKLSAITAYQKTADLLNQFYPDLASIVYSELCLTCLKFIYQYYYFKMHDRSVIRMLHRYFILQKSYLYKDDVFSATKKRFAGVACYNTYLYYLLIRLSQYLAHVSYVIQNRLKRRGIRFLADIRS